MKREVLSIVIFTIFFFSCKKGPSAPAQFRLLKKSATGLNFSNDPVQNEEFNVLKYMYFFNGGGVATGDFNNDGLPDLFFTSNQGQDKLFLNQGGMKFKEETQAAGLMSDRLPGTGGRWKTGVSIIDLNNDGMLDLYVSQVADYQNVKGQNELWICQGIEHGIPRYADEAIRYGLDLQGFGTQAAFFDYDLDGDLDVFQLNHSLHQNGTFGQRKEFVVQQHPLAGDFLLRNDTPLGNKGEMKFTDVTLEAGILSTVVGYGLGIVTGDINLDGYPDIYIGNDFHENDYLYINTPLEGGERGFREVLTEQMQHTSRFSMGVDFGDINNDGWNEIVSLDMEPEDPNILKASLGEDGFAVYQFKLGYGYHNQYARNSLQFNHGDTPFGGGAGGVKFSDISLFSGVAATDWSWAPLFLDFDQDGYKDLFISNGIPRRMNDIDYTNFMANNEVAEKAEFSTLEKKDLSVVEKMPQIKLPNKFFQNGGDLRFQDIGEQVEDNLPSFSNGAVYADFDNDGDLDVVVNNINDEPFLYQNLNVENKIPNRNALTVKLKGTPANIDAIGARVVVFKKGGEKIMAENFPVRGYQSSALTLLHLGVGDTATVDSVVVLWPDRTVQRLADFAYNRTLQAEWKAGLPLFNFENLKLKNPSPYYFEDRTAASGIAFQHKENPFVEFNRELLMPHMVSSEGPALAVGDLNGDGREDLFFGSAKRERSALFFQNANGSFSEKTPAAILADSVFEDVDAVMNDLDKDGDLDLVVAAGGNEYWGEQAPMRQRYYKNDGRGNFQRIDFQGVYMTASCVLPADFNGDGLTDFFFGARAVTEHYGEIPGSVLLLNKGNGNFENVTEASGGGMGKAGLVKNGAWADMDADGDPDLVLAIEWEPLTVFLNNAGTFEKKTIGKLSGWWNFVLPHDFDGDGDLDLLAGNLGSNSKLRPTPGHPVRMYVSDFDGNGKAEQLLCYWLGGREIPFGTHAEIIKQMPSLKKKFLFAKDFAKASPADLVGADKLKAAKLFEVNELRSMYFENKGSLQFEAKPLPDALQFSTLNAVALSDLDGDGRQEALLGGNFYDCNIEMGRYDGSYGNVLSFSKDGKMTAYSLGDLRIEGQVRRIEALKVGSKTYFVFARNNAGAVVVEARKAGEALSGK